MPIKPQNNKFVCISPCTVQIFVWEQIEGGGYEEIRNVQQRKARFTSPLLKSELTLK